MPRQSIIQKYNLQRLLAYLLPGDRVVGPQYYTVRGVSRSVLAEAVDELLIVAHSTHKHRYAITKRGYDALKTGYFESYRLHKQEMAQAG